MFYVIFNFLQVSLTDANQKELDFNFLKQFEKVEQEEQALVNLGNSHTELSMLTMSASSQSDITKKISFLDTAIEEMEKPVKWMKTGYQGRNRPMTERHSTTVGPSSHNDDLSTALFRSRFTKHNAASPLNEALLNLSVVEQKHEGVRFENFELVNEMVSESYSVPSSP